MAGDMTEYSDREDVKLLRDSNGVRKIIALNFNDKSILNSPYYYLDRYDIILVQPKHLKLFTENFGRTVTIVAGITSLLALVLVLVKN